jgi:transposase
MSTLLKYALGLDMAKEKFDACLSALHPDQAVKVKARRKFANTPAGFAQLAAWLKKHLKQQAPLSVVLEATGVYHENLAVFLFEQGHQVSVVLPNKARHYLRALGHKSKNDRADAQGLAQLAAQQRLEPWRPAGRFYRELRQLTRHHQSLQQARTLTRNQLHALAHGAHSSKQVVKQLQRTLALIEGQICQTKKAIAEQVAGEPEVKRKLEQVCRVKGLALLTVATVVAETAGFALFDNQRQLISYAGYDVVENQSGKRVGKTRISKKGNSRIRRILHMGALGAVRHGQQPFASLYERVFSRTGLKMKAYVAVQKKLLVLIYALWKKDEPFQSPESRAKETATGPAPEKALSGNLEPEPLFPVTALAGQTPTKKSSPARGRATQDEHPSNLPPGALFPVYQR